MVVVLIVGGVVFWREQVGAPETDNSKVVMSIPKSVSIAEVDNIKVVTDNERKYNVSVPSNWKVTGIEDTLILDGISDAIVGSSGVSGEGCKVVIKPTDIQNLNQFFSKACESNFDCESYQINSFNENIEAVRLMGNFMGSGDVEYYLRSTSGGGFDRLTMVCSSQEDENVYRDDILSSFVRN
ncbi:MAG: hypothetical protein COX83_02360 [Candidatus Magasanikbacteria bacterium CG_4_10_14_0_2_um_filter_41_31]|uniref:Uncharacterized protein n=1 Tax=Candidatus Magasanikbacteria bacterium CG_4_10_14_0_2_um_filter_41_31 TaxID=1974639 RepID=A0A2M7V454_9BACT|nr:MAG: hypothetical protein COX83_02360 [Candidatus Magasanikbacteria bacterium CG_4_10_14_0_2_um_filter_41_31]